MVARARHGHVCACTNCPSCCSTPAHAPAACSAGAAACHSNESTGLRWPCQFSSQTGCRPRCCRRLAAPAAAPAAADLQLPAAAQRQAAAPAARCYIVATAPPAAPARLVPARSNASVARMQTSTTGTPTQQARRARLLRLTWLLLLLLWSATSTTRPTCSACSAAWRFQVVPGRELSCLQLMLAVLMVAMPHSCTAAHHAWPDRRIQLAGLRLRVGHPQHPQAAGLDDRCCRPSVACREPVAGSGGCVRQPGRLQRCSSSPAAGCCSSHPAHQRLRQARRTGAIAVL